MFSANDKLDLFVAIPSPNKRGEGILIIETTRLLAYDLEDDATVGAFYPIFDVDINHNTNRATLIRIVRIILAWCIRQWITQIPYTSNIQLVNIITDNTELHNTHHVIIIIIIMANPELMIALTTFIIRNTEFLK